MRSTACFLIVTIVLSLVTTQSAGAQTAPDIWRSFAERVETGTELNVRLKDGRRLRATLVGVRPDAMLMQPRTRVPVPIQAIPYEEVVGLERARKGMGAGKAVAIGVATGVGAFFGTFAVLAALLGD